MSTRAILASAALLCLLGFVAASAAEKAGLGGADALPAGSLKASPSLYLRQSASSAIRWQPWSPATFELAHKLNRPMLIDIGAVWCHWCHVMDQTTYADPEIAKLLNSAFVPVKVDTDERPDIDGYYQDAAAHLTGAGGWPLTCFATSSGALLYAAGYLPPRPGAGPEGSGTENSSMLPLLQKVAAAYEKDPVALERGARATAAKIGAESGARVPAQGRSLDAMRAQILAGLAATYDSDAGGFSSGSGARFYDFPAIRLALAHGFFGHPEYTAMALDSLMKIAAGGVFDQLGGGFHRYSTDRNWGVPHFEKLAYDNAMALHAYADAFEATRDADMARVTRALVEYVNRDLLDPKTDTFYSHQDADSFAGDDGSYYTWTVAEVEHALRADQARAAIAYYGLGTAPAKAPDGRIVLRRAMDPAQLATALKTSPDHARELIAKATGAMLEARSHRPTPLVDRSILTDRNALMASAFLTASAALGDAKLQKTALADIDFILGHMRAPDGAYFHAWSDGRAHVPGLAADQVYLLTALIDAYQYSGNTKYLDEAKALAQLVLEKFREPGSGLLINRGGGENGTVAGASPARSQVLYDTPMPSVQATMAIAMAKLGVLTGDSADTKAAGDLLATAPTLAASMMPTMIATIGLALEYRAHGDASVVVVGASGDRIADAMWRAALTSYRPGKVVARIEAGRSAGASLPPAARAMVASAAAKNAPYGLVCVGDACMTPVETAEQLTEAIGRFGLEREGKPKVAEAR